MHPMLSNKEITSISKGFRGMLEWIFRASLKLTIIDPLKDFANGTKGQADFFFKTPHDSRSD